MDDEKVASRGGSVVLGVLLALGLIVGGWVLGRRSKPLDWGSLCDCERTGGAQGQIRPRPLAAHLQGSGRRVVVCSMRRPRPTRRAILQFLDEQGIQPSEIELGIIRVVDTQANEYGGGTRAPHRYIVEQQITVRTARVDQVAAAAQKTMLLLQKGLVLGGNPGQGLSYKFTGIERHQARHDHRGHAQRPRRR